MITNKVFYLLSTLEAELKANHVVEAYETAQALRYELELEKEADGENE